MNHTLKPINFQFITVVWGKSYIDLLIKVAIPSQMAAGNLPSFPYLETSTYIIYTTSEGRDALDNSLAFRHLSQIMETEVRLIDYIDFNRNKYGIAAECQKLALSSSLDTDVAFVWLYPDVVWPNGAITNMGRIASTGKRAVLHVGLSAVTETCVPALVKWHHEPTTDTVTIPTRDLIKLAIEHLDPAIHTLCWNSDHFNSSPSQLFWEVPDEGFVTRWFHLVPLMVYPRQKYSEFTDSIDSGDYLSKSGLKQQEIHIANDSDEIFQFSLRTPKETFPANTSSTAKVLRWTATTTGAINRDNLNHQFRIHYTDLSEKWIEVERESDEIIESIARSLKFRFLFLFTSPKQLSRRFSWKLRHSLLGRAIKLVLKKGVLPSQSAV